MSINFGIDIDDIGAKLEAAKVNFENDARTEYGDKVQAPFDLIFRKIRDELAASAALKNKKSGPIS